jgi:hypothetical protein
VRIWALIAIGGILLFAAVGHPFFLNLQVLGLILLVRGVAGLWISLGAKGRAECVRRVRIAVTRGMGTLDGLTADFARDDATRVPLTDLLGPRGRDRG